ncbi:MAG: helix-turn-helix domain-containing protein [Acidimicrobiales bacterium]
MTPEEVIAAVSPTFSQAGSAWYFVPETLALGKAAGLDGLRFYFLGRGGTLGRVDWRVVCSAFGYFKPSLVERMWTTARERCSVEAAVSAHLGACADFGRRRLGEVGGLGSFCEAADQVVAGAVGDLGGLTLFAAYAGQPLPEDLPARAAQLIATLRELRGSAHLTAVRATGLATPVAHAIRRPADIELFGWGRGEAPEPTEEDRHRLGEADRITDRILLRPYADLDARAGEALVAGAKAVAATLATEPPVPGSRE